MRLTTWNVNGIRNPFSYAPWNTTKTFPAMFDILDADIIVMQELKIQRKDLRDDMVILDGWDCYFSVPKQKKGYSGVGIYTRNATCSPIRAEEGITGVLTPPNSTTQYRNLPEPQQIGGYPSEFQISNLGIDPLLLDSEGRCVCLEFPAFVLFGVYSPANSNGERDEFRYGFLCALDCRIRNLVKMGKRVILVGDLNVSRGLIDTASATEDIKKSGLAAEEYVSTPNRRIFNQLIVNGEVYGERDEGREEPIMLDLAREFHPDRTGMYTHWEVKINARPGNFGSRIDFVLASSAMKDWFAHADIQEGLMGSDHCPVYGDFKDVVNVKCGDESQKVKLVDIMNPPGVFVDGVRQKEWEIKELPPFSARLMPEFYNRRSIKDMFGKSAASSSKGPAASAKQPQSASLTENASSAASPGKPSGSASPTIKRKVSEASTLQPVKKQKPATSAKSTTAKGQKSLTGFFQPKPKPASAGDATTEKPSGSSKSAKVETEMNGGNLNESEKAITSATRQSPPELGEEDCVKHVKPNDAELAEGEKLGDTILPDDDEMVYDPIENKESWQTLFRKRSIPRCEGHQEPCKSMQTRKKGENQGRSFWMCARPLGPSGVKEKGTQWRCGTFIWCSDFKSGEA
uniref:DNA-(apurinic or apyrimidinic site) endonuclease 2 n=1 Tax=Aureobasidium zeae TaxID=1592451 RepID=A0A482LTF3_9PEZI|nr:APN2 [Aureobasidium zeae]